MAKIILDGVLEKLSTLADGSVKIHFNTQELDNSNAATLFQFRGKYVKFLISDTNISSPEEILIDEVKIQDGRKLKTKSQRLRAVLFRYFEQVKPDVEFEKFYEEKMESLIEHFKSKLE